MFLAVTPEWSKIKLPNSRWQSNHPALRLALVRIKVTFDEVQIILCFYGTVTHSTHTHTHSIEKMAVVLTLTMSQSFFSIQWVTLDNFTSRSPSLGLATNSNLGRPWNPHLHNRTQNCKNASVSITIISNIHSCYNQRVESRVGPLHKALWPQLFHAN